MNDLFDRLIGQLQYKSPSPGVDAVQDDGDPSSAGAVDTVLAANLLQLKMIHRDVFVGIQQAEAEYNRKLSFQQKRQRNEDALLYEKRQLEQRMQALQTFSTPNLLRLAREELQRVDDRKSMSDSGNMVLDEADLLRAYFEGREISNPDHRDAILQRLHDEISRRGNLEQTLKAKKEELGKLLKELKNVTQVLTSLPQQVSAIERASIPLQKTFAAANPLTGTERKTRIEHAQSLPPPLYVLYQQLQVYLDFERSDTEEVDRPSLVIDKNIVSLQLPVQDLTAAAAVSSTHRKSNSKRVSIIFAYDEASKLVTAVAAGCGNLLFQEALLLELFADDTPANSAVRSDTSRAVPYQWCNYLAGLHLLPSRQLRRHENHSAYSCFPSTRVIVVELQRRVRANAILKYILQSLSRGTLPVLPFTICPAPSTAYASVEGCKVSHFEPVEKNDQNPHLGEYSMTFELERCRLRALVRINKSRYPAIPPVWSLLSSTSGKDPMQNDTGSDPALYDAVFAECEHHVNLEMIQQLCRSSASSASSESGFDWIFGLQVRYIVASWASIPPTSDSMLSSSTGRGRKRKSNP
jgi:hypothetical protein